MNKFAIFWFIAWLTTSVFWIINSRFFARIAAGRRIRQQEVEFFKKMSQMDIEIKELLDAADEVDRRRSMAAHPTAMRKKRIPELDLGPIAKQAIEDQKNRFPRKYIKNYYLKYYWDNRGGKPDSGYWGWK